MSDKRATPKQEMQISLIESQLKHIKKRFGIEDGEATQFGACCSGHQVQQLSDSSAQQEFVEMQKKYIAELQRQNLELQQRGAAPQYVMPQQALGGTAPLDIQTLMQLITLLSVNRSHQHGEMMADTSRLQQMLANQFQTAAFPQQAPQQMPQQVPQQFAPPPQPPPHGAVAPPEMAQVIPKTVDDEVDPLDAKLDLMMQKLAEAEARNEADRKK